MFSVYVKFVKQKEKIVKKSTTNNCQKKLCTFALSLTRLQPIQINKFSERAKTTNKQAATATSMLPPDAIRCGSVPLLSDCRCLGAPRPLLWWWGWKPSTVVPLDFGRQADAWQYFIVNCGNQLHAIIHTHTHKTNTHTHTYKM